MEVNAQRKHTQAPHNDMHANGLCLTTLPSHNIRARSQSQDSLQSMGAKRLMQVTEVVEFQELEEGELLFAEGDDSLVSRMLLTNTEPGRTASLVSVKFEEEGATRLIMAVSVRVAVTLQRVETALVLLGCALEAGGILDHLLYCEGGTPRHALSLKSLCFIDVKLHHPLLRNIYIYK